MGDAARERPDALHPLRAEELRLQLPHLGDVGVHDQDRAGRARLVPHERPTALHHQLAAVPRPLLEDSGPDALLEHHAARLEQLAAIADVEKVGDVLPDRLRGGPGIELLGAAVPVADAVLHVLDEDRLVGQVQERGLLAQPLLPVPAIGHVLDDTQHLRRRPVGGAAEHDHPEVEGPPGPGAGLDRQLELGHLVVAGGGEPGDQVLNAPRVLGVGDLAEHGGLHRLDLLRRVAEHGRHLAVDVAAPPVGDVEDEHHVGRGVDHPLEEALAAGERLLGLAAGRALGGLVEGAADDGHQAREMVLEHVVGGSRLEGVDGPFIAQRSGKEDEGQLRPAGAGGGEGGRPAEGGKRVVREDHVEAAGLQGLRELRARDHAPDLAIEARAEGGLDQLGVHVVVLQMEDAHPAVGGGAAHGPFRTLPGGASLITAQKTPSSRTAWTKRLNSTGFTTYAFTPSR